MSRPLKKIFIGCLVLIALLGGGIVYLFTFGETAYQKQADKTRVQDLFTIANWIEAYYDEVGYYPFANKGEANSYNAVLIGSLEQTDGLVPPPWIQEVRYSVEDFEKELSEVLGQEVQLPFDPQNYSTDSRPNVYDYKTYNGDYFLKVYLYKGNDYTQFVGTNFYTLEVSSSNVCDGCEGAPWNFRSLEEKINPENF